MELLNTILFFVLTLLLMAFFAGIEMAFYSANRLSLELRKKEARGAVEIVSQFIESPAKFVGITLIGFNLFLVFLGLQISAVMQPLWNNLKVVYTVRIITEIVLATFIVLILAEFIPRAYFRARSNKILIRLAYVSDFFYQMFAPFASALMGLSGWILKYVFNVRVDRSKEPINRNDLKNLFLRKDDEEKLDRNAQLMENAQELPKVKIRQCLVPRKEIIGVESHSSIDELKQIFIETKLSKLLVYEENIDHIIGYVHQLDLFKRPNTITDVLLPIPAVPESMSATDLIGKFTRERKSIAWVVDEFGGTAGIITMEDVLEELFGEIQDEYDTEELLEKEMGENEYIFSGRLELDYLSEKYGFEFASEESETLSGYIINYHEKIPRQKERIIIDDYEFDIVTVSDTRIEVVKMKRLK